MRSLSCKQRPSCPSAPVTRIFMTGNRPQRPGALASLSDSLIADASGPLNRQLRIIPENGALVIRIVVIRTFILKICHVTQHQKTVGEAVASITGACFSFNNRPCHLPKLGESRRKSTATSNTSPRKTLTNFPCGLLIWKCKPRRTPFRYRVVILNKGQRNTRQFCIARHVKGFQKKPTVVAERAAR